MKEKGERERERRERGWYVMIETEMNRDRLISTDLNREISKSTNDWISRYIYQTDMNKMKFGLAYLFNVISTPYGLSNAHI